MACSVWYYSMNLWVYEWIHYSEKSIVAEQRVLRPESNFEICGCSGNFTLHCD